MAFSSIREKRDFEEQGDTHPTLIKKAFLIRHVLVIILLITDFQCSKCGWVICNRLIFNFILWYYSLQLYFSISWSWDGQLVAQSKLRVCIKINTFSYHMLWTGSPVFWSKRLLNTSMVSLHLHHYWLGNPWSHSLWPWWTIVCMNLKIWGWQWWWKIHNPSNFISINLTHLLWSIICTECRWTLLELNSKESHSSQGVH